jgi:hypothetical protein
VTISASYTTPRDSIAHCDEVIVLLCLRQPYALRLSLIQQHLKSGVTIEDEVRSLAKPGFFRQTVGRIRSVFGEERVRFSVFEEMQAHPGGLVGAFAELIGLEPTVTVTERREHFNPSMSLRACLVLDRLNRNVPLRLEGRMNPARTRRVENWVRGLSGPRFVLKPEQTGALRAAVDDDRAFADEIFGRQIWAEGVPEVPVRATHVRWVRTIAWGAGLAGRVFD